MGLTTYEHIKKTYLNKIKYFYISRYLMNKRDFLKIIFCKKKRKNFFQPRETYKINYSLITQRNTLLSSDLEQNYSDSNLYNTKNKNISSNSSINKEINNNISIEKHKNNNNILTEKNNENNNIQEKKTNQIETENKYSISVSIRSDSESRDLSEIEVYPKEESLESKSNCRLSQSYNYSQNTNIYSNVFNSSEKNNSIDSYRPLSERIEEE